MNELIDILRISKSYNRLQTKTIEVLKKIYDEDSYVPLVIKAFETSIQKEKPQEKELLEIAAFIKALAKIEATGKNSKLIKFALKKALKYPHRGIQVLARRALQ